MHQIYPSDRAHRMPIITPAYPSMCSTHNVAASQLAVMTQEFKRGISGVCSCVALAPLTSMHQGHEIVERVLFGKATWDELWVKHDFFHRYHNYLQVVASAGDQDTALKWSATSSSERSTNDFVARSLTPCTNQVRQSRISSSSISSEARIRGWDHCGAPVH